MGSFNLSDYEPVEDRLARFWAEHPNGRVATYLVHHADGQYIVKSELYREATDEHPWSTGYAEETVATRGVNQTSALENCETSSLGRCLANAGSAPKAKRPSREEMMKVERMTKPPTRINLEALKLALAGYSSDTQERKAYVLRTLGLSSLGNLNELTDDQIELVSKSLKNGTAPFTEKGE